MQHVLLGICGEGKTRIMNSKSHYALLWSNIDVTLLQLHYCSFLVLQNKAIHTTIRHTFRYQIALIPRARSQHWKPSEII